METIDIHREGQDFCNKCQKMKKCCACIFGTENSNVMCSNVQKDIPQCGLSNHRIHVHSLFFKIYLTLTLVGLHGIQGFNIDVANRIEFPGPNPGSYFGYSVAMMNSRTQGKWLLFGAPRDNSSNLPNAVSPGAIYRCTLHSDLSGQSCEELLIDNAEGTDSAPFGDRTRVFIHGRDNQWLGASLDVQRNEGIATCASRWFNKYFENEEYYFMNGLCYEIPLDFNPANIRKVPALVDGQKQTMTIGGGNSTKLNYGMGCMGWAVHYTSQGSDLLLGAPGLRASTGGFIDLRQPDDSYITDYVTPPTEISEMAGYALTSGHYFGDGPTYFAVGAPRQKLTGKVFLFRGDLESFIMEQADLTLNGSEITEIPVNGFFGGALCSVDVNKDGFDDLLVGAPFINQGDKDETGMVMVYLGTAHKNQGFKPMNAILTGNDAVGARFGTVISSIGDLNKDSYNDIIVGAPYEDDLNGAIYVYNGCKTGIWPEFSQRIPASAVRPGIKSFGISLSKAEDMNDDGVNDIAVGAYLSDKAYLLFGQSVININITLETRVTQIDKDSSDLCPLVDGSTLVPCFTIKVCFYYLNRQFSTIEVNVTASLDTYMKEYNRIAWQTTGSSELSFKRNLFSGDQICKEESVIIKSTSDLVTPVRIAATYDVIDIPTGGAGIKPTVNKFNGDNPQLNLLTASKILDFKKDCPNNDCRTDLHLEAEADYDKTDKYFIIGTSSLVIDISIAKTGHPSYSSNFFMAFPKILQYQKVVTVYGDTEINCGFVTDSADDNDADDKNSLDYLQRRNIPAISESEVLMACSFGNPMYNDTGVRFSMILAVPESANITRLEFRLNATTLSTELQPADNVKSLLVEVRNKVATTFTGISRPSYITMRDPKEKYVASHIYEFRNKGPSPLPAASLLVLYPQVQRGGSPWLYLNATTWSCLAPCRVVCMFPDTAHTAPVVFTANIGSTYLIDNTPESEKVGESRTIKDMQNIDCEKGGCSRYECDLFDIPARESAVVTLEYVVAGNILDKVSDGDALRIRSESSVRPRELERLITETTVQITDVYTELLPVSPPPQRIPWWVILVSVLAGILLIVIVALILWKVGFFRRKKLEEMKKMQHEVEVEKKLLDPEDGTKTP